MQLVTSMRSLHRHLSKSGCKVYVFAKITKDDEVLVKISKSEFLSKIQDWTDRDLGEVNSNVHIQNGDIYVG